MMNEQQLREYIEKNVRESLINEGIDEGFLGMNWSWETIVGAVLGRVAVAPILSKLLESIGIPADSAFGKWFINTAVTVGGAKIGDWIDKNHNLIGKSNAPEEA